LNIDEKVKETLVVVSANKIDKEVQNLINYIEYSSEYLIGIVEDKASIIDIGEIIRVYIEDRKTFVVTLKDTYVVKKKLYEVENMVTRNFIKISMATLTVSTATPVIFANISGVYGIISLKISLPSVFNDLQSNFR